MNGEQLVKRHGKADFVGGIQTGQHGVGRFQIAAHTLGIDGGGGDAHHMANGAADGAVNGLIGLGLDADTDGLVVGQHFVDGIDQLPGSPDRALALCAQGPLTGQPQNNQVTSQLLGNVDGAVGTPHGELPVLGVGAHEAAVLGVLVHPQPGSHELSLEAVLVQQLFDFPGVGLDLFLSHVVHVGHSVIIMELNGGKAQFRKPGEFGFQINGLTGFGAVGIRTGVNIPGAHREFELRHDKYLQKDVFECLSRGFFASVIL